jgi:MATE family multidrug resistance protein
VGAVAPAGVALAGPIIHSDISALPLGAVDTEVMGHLPEPSNIGGAAVGALAFDSLYWGFS